MHPKHCQYSVLTIAALLLASPVRAQDNPLGNPDLKEMLKQAAEMQKKAGELHKQNPSSHDMRKKLEIKRFRMKLNLWPRIQPHKSSTWSNILPISYVSRLTGAHS